MGKTTLVGHLAVEAERRRRAKWLITDPQGSLAAWWNQREVETPLFVMVDLARLDTHKRSAELRDHGVKIVMIDTPPAVNHIEKVIAVADLVLVPVRPEPSMIFAR